MSYTVLLAYFRPTGKYLASAETVLAYDEIAKIWEEIHEMRKLGRLPGLRPNAGRDLFIIVDVPDHPQRVPHLVTPPFVDEDDVTPSRIATGVSKPTVQIEELSRTTTRDVVKIDLAVDDLDDAPDPTPAPLPDPPDEP